MTGSEWWSSYFVEAACWVGLLLKFLLVILATGRPGRRFEEIIGVQGSWASRIYNSAAWFSNIVNENRPFWGLSTTTPIAYVYLHISALSLRILDSLHKFNPNVQVLEPFNPFPSFHFYKALWLLSWSLYVSKESLGRTNIRSVITLAWTIKWYMYATSVGYSGK